MPELLDAASESRQSSRITGCHLSAAHITRADRMQRGLHMHMNSSIVSLCQDARLAILTRDATQEDQIIPQVDQKQQP